MAEMLAGEIEGAIGLAEEAVGGVVARGVARGDTETERHFGPDDAHWLLQFLAVAGMECFDHGARHVELLLQWLRGKRVYTLAESVATQQNAFFGKEPVARIPDQA